MKNEARCTPWKKLMKIFSKKIPCALCLETAAETCEKGSSETVSPKTNRRVKSPLVFISVFHKIVPTSEQKQRECA